LKQPFKEPNYLKKILKLLIWSW